MTRIQTILACLAVAIVAWGCGKTQTTQSTSGTSNPSKSLEARVTKLEQELKASQTLALEHETKWKNEVARAQLLEKERDALQSSLKVRTSERDNVQTQYDGFRKSLKELVGQMEAAANNQTAPTMPAITVPSIPSGTGESATVQALPPPKGL